MKNRNREVIGAQTLRRTRDAEVQINAPRPLNYDFDALVLRSLLFSKTLISFQQ